MLFLVSWPKSFFQEIPKRQCAAIYHHLETATVLGFDMISNLRARMTVHTLGTVWLGDGKTEAGMKNTKVLAVHCVTWYIKGTEHVLIIVQYEM